MTDCGKGDRLRIVKDTEKSGSPDDLSKHGIEMGDIVVYERDVNALNSGRESVEDFDFVISSPNSGELLVKEEEVSTVCMNSNHQLLYSEEKDRYFCPFCNGKQP